MIISPPNITAKINMSTLKIEQKSYMKYLGVYIDDHLNWNIQIKHINKKNSKNIGIINKLRHYIDLKTIKQIYYTMIYPYLNYGLMSWGNTYKTKLSKTTANQNRCIRNIFFANQRESATPLYQLLGILKLDNIFKLKMSIFAFQILNNKSKMPAVFHDVITQASDVHQYNTRYSANKNLHRPFVRTNYGQHTFKYMITKIWENIPTTIKNHKFHRFKASYKQFLLSEQN